ncbi:DUF1056 family protein [Leuconostoc gelidum]|uniref:DUF1056 family protein n=1 Tax=Leuconostoc gelidum TaxID=1244 RepID=UPI00021923E4|nr:DUF1056 family protein [Leuconostoc gelidum]GMA66780.1 hypothetical protein GCM10025884_04070 [Leuconostoc gelidum subsp. gelidum]
MIKNFTKFITAIWQNLLSVILFISGIALIDIGAFYFNFIVGFIATGVSLVIMAVTLDKEGME